MLRFAASKWHPQAVLAEGVASRESDPSIARSFQMGSFPLGLSLILNG